ncbi:hypothetical protein EE612_025966 [Oryza sativa]|nr:hypothetical protein EE612_025966 [Oryza sativa]
MMLASISTVPRRVSAEPLPELKKGSLSSSRTTASTTSSAAAPERSASTPTCMHRASTRFASSCLCSGRFGSTPAPPWIAMAHLAIDVVFPRRSPVLLLVLL